MAFPSTAGSAAPLATLLALAAAPLAAVPLATLPAGAVQPPPPVNASTLGRPPAPVTRPAAPGSVTATRPGSATPPGSATGAGSATTAAVTSNKEIVLELGKRTISLVEDGKVTGSWPVAIGDPETPTPTGVFKVRNKVLNPQYQSTKSGKVNATVGPDGPLGDRWLGFHTTAKDQFGIHGTPNAWAWAVNSRAAVTHGCVRMLGPHVRYLFQRVDVGTPVVVKP